MVGVHRAGVVVHFNYDVVWLWEGGGLVGCYIGRYLGYLVVLNHLRGC